MKPKKTFSVLTIFILLASAALSVNSTCALVTNPSVPEFTVSYVDHSFDIPPTYGKDAYTGQTKIISGGRHVDNRTIDIAIQNQQFTPYLDSNNHTIGLYYSVRSKGYFEDWTDGSVHIVNGVQASTTSASTAISIDFSNWGVQQGGQIDFQVAAVAGYPASDAAYCGSVHFNTISQSDWSSTQTITIGNPITSTPIPQPYTWPTPTIAPYPTATASPQQIPTTTPNLPNILTGVLVGVDLQQSILIVMAVVIVVLAITLVVVLWRKNSHTSDYS
jgi:hypothetical protein